ncbi:MAG: zinc-dependent peptidase [Bacteroidetes bacterium]|nr:zinc-dependent peptidase [Bacteroidota bacterium]
MSQDFLIFVFIVFAIAYLSYGSRDILNKLLIAFNIKIKTKAYKDFVILWHPILINKFPFYVLLNATEQDTFCYRTRNIMRHLEFVDAEEGEFITETMEVCVSASLAQITFGWQDYLPPNLKKIVLFKDTYYSNLFHRDVKGLTFAHHTMLSWRYFEEGFKDETDKLNLALHEMGHVLWVNRKSYPEEDEEIKEWEWFAKQEMAKMLDNPETAFLREYAATNLAEMWACSIETFFEAPVEFKQKLPEIYGKMAKILNQDMAGRVGKIKRGRSTMIS